MLHFHGFEHHDALSLGDRIVRLGEHIDDDAVHRREQPQRAGAAVRTGGRESRIANLEDIAVEVEVKRIVTHREARALLHAGNIEADNAIIAMNDRDFDPVAPERNQIIVRTDGRYADGMMGVA